MPIPTEPIGSIRRPPALIAAVRGAGAGADEVSEEDLHSLYDQALRDTIERAEATGSPVITDGEQTKPSFATYPVHGLRALAPDGVTIPFADGHTRQLPRLTAGPFRYQTHADAYLEQAKRHAHRPVKQAVIAPSALSLLYPAEGIEGYPREAFLEDLLGEAETDIRRCLRAGAHNVQLDFTEGRLSVKLDASKGLLRDFVTLNNRVLERFSAQERRRIGVHTSPAATRTPPTAPMSTTASCCPISSRSRRAASTSSWPASRIGRECSRSIASTPGRTRRCSWV
jgi:5-methyltetrahydropteroyltriglutamate--homocysteine methyltransferase